MVDDDIALGNVVAMALNDSGYDVCYQASLIAFKSVIQEFKPDIIILDVEIGKSNGIDKMPEIQMMAPATPVLFISSHVEDAEIIRAIDAGGINYLKKPFEIDILLAYLQRYTASFHPKGIRIGLFSLNQEENLLMKEETVVKKLSLFECKLLTLFALHINQPVSREQLEQELWGDGGANEHSLNNYITKLRRCLSGDPSLELVTIPKMGYKLIDPAHLPAED